MATYPDTDKIKDIIEAANTIVIVQADNPDADSLGSALALEQILHDLGKTPYLYSGAEMPGYLRYLTGWDRVEKELPNKFDASIIVDASTMTLLEKLTKSNQQGWLASKPCIVLDHHEIVDNKVPFSTVEINDHNRSSTGELIYLISKQLGWNMSQVAQENIMHSILGDTQGLSNQLATAETYRIMADMIEAGVDRPYLEEKRREYSKMPLSIFRYKADLIKRTEFKENDSIALLVIPQDEINKYSPLYNPGPLIQGDMLQTKNVRVAIVLKYYDDKKVTAAIRANIGAPIAAGLAEHFGGGGHKYAGGFKTSPNQDIDKIKQECFDKSIELLKQIVD